MNDRLLLVTGTSLANGVLALPDPLEHGLCCLHSQFTGLAERGQITWLTLSIWATWGICSDPGTSRESCWRHPEDPSLPGTLNMV